MANSKLVGFYKGDSRMPIYQDQERPDKHYLKQNPDTQSIFAQGAQAGIEVYWIVTGFPIPGAVNYAGEVYINKTRYDRFEARKVVSDLLRQKELTAKED